MLPHASVCACASVYRCHTCVATRECTYMCTSRSACTQRLCKCMTLCKCDISRGMTSRMATCKCATCIHPTSASVWHCASVQVCDMTWHDISHGNMQVHIKNVYTKCKRSRECIHVVLQVCHTLCKCQVQECKRSTRVCTQSVYILQVSVHNIVPTRCAKTNIYTNVYTKCMYSKCMYTKCMYSKCKCSICTT